MATPPSGRVTVNAGGRLYETTIATLLSSDSKYFQDLLLSSGSKSSQDLLGPAASAAPTTSSKRRDKHSKPEDAYNAPRSIFVDCDPDLFNDVLFFMRRKSFRTTTSANVARLTDLQSEAEYFAYDTLQVACFETIMKLRNNEPEAQSYQMRVTAPEPVFIHVPRGSIIYLVSATFVDVEYQLDRNDSYLHVVGSAQLKSSVASYHIRENNTHIQQKNLPIFLSSPEDERVGLITEGVGRWDVICWVGNALAIPGLSFAASNPI
jgi:hypothetical protein